MPIESVMLVSVRTEDGTFTGRFALSVELAGYTEY
jgi:hypothetical protein